MPEPRSSSQLSSRLAYVSPDAVVMYILSVQSMRRRRYHTESRTPHQISGDWVLHRFLGLYKTCLRVCTGLKHTRTSNRASTRHGVSGTPRTYGITISTELLMNLYLGVTMVCYAVMWQRHQGSHQFLVPGECSCFLLLFFSRWKECVPALFYRVMCRINPRISIMCC